MVTAMTNQAKRGCLRRAGRTSVLGTAILLVLLGAVGWRWFDSEILQGLPADLDSLRGWRPASAVVIRAADGTEIDRFYRERRFWVPLAELPSHLPRSVIVAEDRTFSQHKGLDVRGIVRAFAANVKARGTVQGGSTITQQLVKKLLVGQDRTLVRKLREAVLAGRLEASLDKDEILELYLNYVALGAGNHGVEAAAQDYFGVSARAIDAGQSALLAGLIPAPSRYSPRSDPEAAGARRELVLRARVALGDLSEPEIQGFLAEPVVLDAPARDPTGAAYATVVRRQLRRLLGEEVDARGLDVVTALDLDLQRRAQAAVADAVAAVVARQGLRGPRGHVPADERTAWLERAGGLPRSFGLPVAPPPGACFLGLWGAGGGVEAGPFRWSLGLAQRSQVVAAPRAGRGRRSLESTLRAGDVLRVCLQPDGDLVLDPRPWVQGAAVVLENATGRVRALVGGREPSLESYVRATQAKRQPGSTFKPFVYATALQRGASQVDWVFPPVEPVEGVEPKPLLWLRDALARSINEAAVAVYRRQPRGAVRAVAQGLGVRSALRDDPSVALGSSELTPLDLALGYAGIARLGVPTEPVFIDSFADVDGRRIGQAGEGLPAPFAGVRLPGGPGPRVLDEGVAFELVDMLGEVFRSGTARRHRRPDRAWAGKTGTTDDHVDAWFVGFTPRHTVAVWIGVDDRMPLGWGEYGAQAALPAWLAIVEALDDPDERFPAPAGAVHVPVKGRWVWLRRGLVPASALVVPRLGPAPLRPFGAGEID